MVECAVSKVSHGRSQGKGTRAEQESSDASLTYFPVSIALPKTEAVL